MRIIQGGTRTRPQIWAIGGGKGGTGKSFVTSSLGIHLAQSGHRVVLVDGDLGGANLHTFLGLKPPACSLSDIVKGDGGASLDCAAVETGVPRLRLVSGARNRLDIESLKYFQKTRLVRLIMALSADVVLVDLGAGTSLNVLDLFSIADRGILTVVPEPTAIENCYRFLTAAFLRRLQSIGRTLGYQPIVNLVLDPRWRSRPRRPDEILEEIRRIDSCAARALGAHLEAFRPRLIINQARDHQDARVGSLIQTTSERFLGIPTHHVGVIPYDPMLVRSIKSGKSFMLEYPRSATARAITPSWGWVQTWGPCTVLCDESVAAEGEAITIGTGAAGAVEEDDTATTVSQEFIVGYNLTPLIVDEHQMVDLRIRP